MGESNILQKYGILILDVLMTWLQMLKDLFYIAKLDLNREEKYLLFLESIPTQNSYRSKPCIRGQWQSLETTNYTITRYFKELQTANTIGLNVF